MEYEEILLRERMRVSPPSLDEEDGIVVQLYALMAREEAAALERQQKREAAEARR